MIIKFFSYYLELVYTVKKNFFNLLIIANLNRIEYKLNIFEKIFKVLCSFIFLTFIGLTQNLV